MYWHKTSIILVNKYKWQNPPTLIQFLDQKQEYHLGWPNNYACLQMLVNNALTRQNSCVIANNARKTAKAIYPRL